MTYSLALVMLFGADPPRSLDDALDRARRSDAAFGVDWTAAATSDWADANKVKRVLDHKAAFPKPGDLKLAAARELIRRKRGDDAWEHLKNLTIDLVSDPAALHFHRGGVLQTLGRNDDAVREFLALDALPNVPERYAATAKALRNELGNLKRDSLPGVAHDMREIRRRLEIARPDERTQELNRDVIARLDKMINQCKKDADKAKKKSASGKPSKPADESRPFQEKTTGENADGRRFANTGKWGDLPEKERAKALQDLAREFPAHYRDAVEEYFKKLSREGGEGRK
jgi:hypothetical protein